MSSTRPKPALFVREHITQPENRVNLALFGLMALSAVRRRFLDVLSLSSDCVVDPPQDQAGRRPDLVVVDQDDAVRA